MRWPGASRHRRPGCGAAVIRRSWRKACWICWWSPPAGWAGAGAVDCRTVLLPGGAGPLARALRTGQAVSYGTSPRDTLTFSSLEGDRICLALQRELVTLQGTVVEQQEMVLPFPPEASPLPFLATAGTLLLLGMPPEQLMALPTGGP